MAELKYEITEHIGDLAELAGGWTKELNLVSWNDREPKYDLRDWNADHTRMRKGITLSAVISFISKVSIKFTITFQAAVSIFIIVIVNVRLFSFKGFCGISIRFKAVRILYMLFRYVVTERLHFFQAGTFKG